MRLAGLTAAALAGLAACAQGREADVPATPPLNPQAPSPTLPEPGKTAAPTSPSAPTPTPTPRT